MVLSPNKIPFCPMVKNMKLQWSSLAIAIDVILFVLSLWSIVRHKLHTVKWATFLNYYGSSLAFRPNNINFRIMMKKRTTVMLSYLYRLWNIQAFIYKQTFWWIYLYDKTLQIIGHFGINYSKIIIYDWETYNYT